MPIPLGYSTLTGSTPYNLALDCGLVVLNFNKTIFESTGSAVQAMASSASSVNALTGLTVYPINMGATRGGQLINPAVTEREIEFDGRKSNIAGMSRRDMIMPYAEVTLLEVGGANQVELALGSGTVTNTTGGHTKIIPSYVINNTDYYLNVAFIIASTHSSGLPIVHILDYVRVSSPEAEDYKDHSESTQKVRLTAHALATNPTLVPYSKYVPFSAVGS